MEIAVTAAVIAAVVDFAVVPAAAALAAVPEVVLVVSGAGADEADSTQPKCSNDSTPTETVSSIPTNSRGQPNS